jgi:hypothetical protein
MVRRNRRSRARSNSRARRSASNRAPRPKRTCPTTRRRTTSP